jgi:predicted ATPase with chaperone activity
MSEPLASTAREAASNPVPPAPSRLRDAGVPESVLEDLLVKVLYLRGRLRMSELADHLCLPPPLLETLLTRLRAERLCEMTRRGVNDATAVYALVDAGRTRALELMQRSRWAGAAPVSLDDYVARVRAQSIRDMRVTRDTVERAFRGEIVHPQLLERFGAAMNSGRSIFVYGPPGSGKTYIAERLAGLLGGEVAVPHAVLVDGEIVAVFDRLVHDEIDAEPGGGLDQGEPLDRRWVRCRRPVVRTGAELTLAMVDLQFDAKTRYYQAPPQVKANNGLFVVDDLGRQLVPAQDLMNRWIVPLDRGIDHLALHTGTQFLLPFDVLVVFSSNLMPSDLADPAFLRRLGYKIEVGPIDATDYRRIFELACAQAAIDFDEAAFATVLRRHAAEGRPLLACVPRDLIEQVRDRARFRAQRATLDDEALDWAWTNYFARH